MDSAKTGLFFGSFNPVHTGHLIIANHCIEHTDIEEVWFVLSPQNPFKEEQGLLAEEHRLELLRLAVEDHAGFRVCEVELQMPRPSYTINTIKKLKVDYPEKDFVLLMGSDNLQDFSKWKDHEQLIEQVTIFVYPRPGVTDSPHLAHPWMSLINAPLLEISSSHIRQQIARGKRPRYLLPDRVLNAIASKGWYRRG